jgi:hypothetical protein
VSDGRPTAPRLRRIVLAPSAPLVLPEVSPAQAAEHRDDVRRLRDLAADALATLEPDADVVVVAAGTPAGVHSHGRVDLRPLGLGHVTRDVPVPAGLAGELAAALQQPLLVDEPLGVDAAVLAASLPPDRPATAAEVPPAADGGVLVALGAALLRLPERTGRDLQVVAAGDLSAGLGTASPAYALPDAAETQARLVAALRAGDPDAVAAMGPAVAGAAVRSWAPLCVAASAAAAAGLHATSLEVATVRGVGHAVGVLA